MTTRLHTQDPTKRLTYLGVRQRAIREHLLQRLTEKQYRRVALLYGFDREPMSFRKVAKAEGVIHTTIQTIHDRVLAKFKQNGYLWLLWVVGKHFMSYNTYTSEAAELHEAETSKRPDTATDQEMEEMYDRGFTIVEPYPGKDGWASDQYHPESTYDRELDRLTDEFENGSLTRVEYDRDMILAFAADKYEDADTLESDWIELKQEVEWALGARELGAITRRDSDHRVSLALRSYVNRE